MLKKAVWTIAIAMAVMAATRVQASDVMKAMIGPYLQIQANLAADTIDGVKPAAKTIGEEAARLGADGDAIVKSAKAVENANDIKAVRLAFGDLSAALIAAGKADGWKDTPDVKVAYCPMVKKHWVQKEPEIRNPYYGKSMLTCGNFVK